MIAIVASDTSGFKYLLKRVEVINKYCIHELKVYECMHNCKKIIIASLGYCKINITLSLRELIKRYNITYLVNVGCCASLYNCRLGIAVSNSFMQYDVDLTKIGYKPGVVPGFGLQIIPASTKLMNIMKSTSNEVMFGRFGSADRFVEGFEEKDKLYHNFGINFIDMESSSIAFVALLYNIPYIAIKGISDNCSSDDYEANYITSSADACNVAFELINNLC